MRIVWPVTEPAGPLDLITIGNKDFEDVVHRLGFLLAGGAREWEVVPGSRFLGHPEFGVVAVHASVLTCVVPVVEAYREAA